jgi:hypothetical protein
MEQMDWLNRTLTKLWPYIDQVSVGACQDFSYKAKLAVLFEGMI